MAMGTSLDISILDHIPVLVMIVGNDLKLEFLAGLPVTDHGVDRHGLLGQPLHKIQKQLPITQNHVKRCLAGETPIALAEFHKKIYEVIYQPINSPEAGLKVACIAQNVTARIEAEKTLVDQQAQLANSSRLIALGEVAGGMAHEINNPITIILGNCGFLEKIIKKEPFEQKKALERLDKIKSTAERVSNIIRSLLKVSSGSNDDTFCPVELPELIDTCIEIIRERFHHHQINLTYTHQGNTEAFCQPERISQAVLNLLSNALDATIQTNEKWVKIESSIAHGSSTIRITDSGTGIPAQLRQKVFQPFFTTKDINKGTGIGLSLVKSVADQHGGTIRIDDENPHTSFVLTWKNILANKSA
jgi:C4-dicarboxylate-specific signal transduction histidine kinase